MAMKWFEFEWKWLDNGKQENALVKPFLDGSDVKLLIKGINNRNLKIALAILDSAQAKVPVDTGYLKSRGRVKQVKNGYEVIFDCDYAIYVHENTYARHKVGQPKFLEDAFDEVMAKVKSGGVV